jgi:hypothetical protein
VPRDRDDFDREPDYVARVLARNPDLARPRRLADQMNRQFVGFGNPTLLQAERQVRYLYTNGLSGCLALILSNGAGTYLAHISSENWGRYQNNILPIAKTTLQTFQDLVGLPTAAVLCCSEATSFGIHETLADLIASVGIAIRYIEANQVGVLVGSETLNDGECNSSDELNGIPDRYNDTLASANLLKYKPGTQWPYELKARDWSS